jgi:hypothetical protein
MEIHRLEVEGLTECGSGRAVKCGSWAGSKEEHYRKHKEAEPGQTRRASEARVALASGEAAERPLKRCRLVKLNQRTVR